MVSNNTQRTVLVTCLIKSAQLFPKGNSIFPIYTKKFPSPCSRGSPKASSPFPNQISSIQLFGTSCRGEEVHCPQRMTQNQSTTMEKYGWMGRTEAANSFCYICFVGQQKQGWALLGTPGWEQVSCERLPWSQTHS